MSELMDWGKVTTKSHQLLTYARGQGWSTDDTLCALSEAITSCAYKRFALPPSKNQRNQGDELCVDKKLKFSEILDKTYEALNWAHKNGWTWEETAFAFTRAASLAGFEVMNTQEGTKHENVESN